MAEGIAIRLARPGDAPALNAALRALSRDLGDRHGATDAAIERLVFGPAPVCRAQLAEEAGVVAGVAVYSPVLSTVLAAAGIYVSDLWVAEAARGTGLGRRLLRAAAEDAAAVWDARFLKLAVYDGNAGARRFYRSLGFAPMTGDTIMMLDESGLDALKGRA